MSYSRGMLKDKVTIWAPVEKTSAYGKSGIEYQEGASVWAAVTFQRGARALQNAEVNLSGTIMVRTDIHSDLTRRCRLEWDGAYYIIDSFQTDRHDNICQIIAHEINDIQQKES